MSVPPQSDRLEIWRYTYARSLLIDALVGCEKLLAHPSLEPDWKKALVAQVVVSYARPFTKSQFTPSLRDMPLHEDCVPPDKREIHETLLEMRNRAIGHKDATAFPDTALNRVLVRSHGTVLDLHTVLPSDIERPVLVSTIDLCKILISHCERSVAPFVNAHLLGANRPAEGAYILSTEDVPSEWLRRVE